MILGMGGVGTSAYDEMQRRYGDTVLGVDFNTEKVKIHAKKGRAVLYGDTGDSDFWERLDPLQSMINMVMLALPDPRTTIFSFSIQQMQEKGYKGEITVSVRYEDERHLVQEAGIDAVYSLYEEAGVGFADHVCERIDYCKLKEMMTVPGKIDKVENDVVSPPPDPKL